MAARVAPLATVSRIALIVNAGSGSGPDADRLAACLERSGAQAVETFEVDDAARAASAEVDRIVVAGGDGSIAPAARAAADAGVPLGVVPAGTANDFARALGLPGDEDEACRIAAEGERMRRLDLARMGERPFVNVANAGLAVRAAEEAKGLKRALGPLAYAVGAAVAGARAQPVACTVRCDDEEVFAGEAWQVIVANTGAFGGGAGVDEADPADGCLDVAVVEAGSRLALVRRAGALRRGRIAQQPNVAHGRGARVVVEGDGATAFNVDGEVCDADGRSEFGVERQAFEVVVG
jgi:YegS/Rv2252/BmrU family lipid kinase